MVHDHMEIKLVGSLCSECESDDGTGAFATKPCGFVVERLVRIGKRSKRKFP
jgi:hypothetical protein